MMTYIRKPNLPQSRVVLTVVADMNKDFNKNLKNMGVKCIDTERCIFLKSSESFHGDMQLLHLGGNKAAVLNGLRTLRRKLEEQGFDVVYTEKKPLPEYPFNVLLNCAVAGNRLIGKIDSLDRTVLENIKCYERINVKQGYSKCSVAVVSDNAFITSDSGIYKALKNNGADVLKISSGYIELPHCNYGFIGGCCGKLDADILAFTGDIKKHPDYENIKSFSLNYGVNLLSLSNENLLDVGGILPLMTV